MISGDVIKFFGRVKRLLKKGSDVRDVILSPDQFDRIMDAIPIHLKSIVATAYFNTGMRRAEILNRTWESVDLVDKIITLESDSDQGKRKASHSDSRRTSQNIEEYSASDSHRPCFFIPWCTN